MTRLRTLSAALTAAAVLGSTACGGGGDASDGATGAPEAAGGDPKQLFASTCGGCHTFKDAGTSGTIGPDLDDRKPDQATVIEAIKEGPGSMPANLLEGAQAEEVGAYVEANAGG